MTESRTLTRRNHTGYLVTDSFHQSETEAQISWLARLVNKLGAEARLDLTCDPAFGTSAVWYDGSQAWRSSWVSCELFKKDRLSRESDLWGMKRGPGRCFCRVSWLVDLLVVGLRHTEMGAVSPVLSLSCYGKASLDILGLLTGLSLSINK